MQDDIEKLVSKMEEKVRALDEGSCMDAIIFPLHGSLPPELQVSSFFLILYNLHNRKICLFQIQSVKEAPNSFYKKKGKHRIATLN